MYVISRACERRSREIGTPCCQSTEYDEINHGADRVSRGDSSDSLTRHGQEARYTGSAAGHHLVKVLSSANRLARGVRSDTSLLGGSVRRIDRTNMHVLTRPVTRRMRRGVSISSFLPAGRLSRSVIVADPKRGSSGFNDRSRTFLIVSYRANFVPDLAQRSSVTRGRIIAVSQEE